MFHVLPILDETKLTLMPGNEHSFSFSTDTFLQTDSEDYRFRLRFCGDCGVHPSWMWEGGFPLLYRDIDDALTTETRHHSAYSLCLEENGEDYPRSVYFKLPCPPRCTEQFAAQPSREGRWHFSLWLKGENFAPQDGSSFIRIERFLKKTGRHPLDLNDPADETIRLEIPQGTFDWKNIETDIQLGDETACLLFTVTARKTAGTLFLEDPSFQNSCGQNVLPAFMPANRHHENMNWFGENLSRKEWTELSVVLNGTRLPNALLFQRCHLRSENEIELPPELIRKGENTVTLTNLDRWNGSQPYYLQAMQLLYTENKAVEFKAVPRFVRRNRDFAVMISVRKPGTTVLFQSDSPVVQPVESTIKFCSSGLHTVLFHAGENAADITISAFAKDTAASAVVERIVAKEEDGLLVGTGDSIYVPQDTQSMEDFLVWYLSEHLGNYITFRPTYRWCGTREVNEAMWRRIAQLCNEMQIAYCHMIDGRELPGINANPTRAMLEGEYFVGNQGHERDGAFCYWGARFDKKDSGCNELFYRELRNRILKHPDWSYSNRTIYTNEGIYTYIDPNCKDMKEAHEQFVACVKESLHGVDRHTGPSVLFRDFFSAGLPVGGAETMYGSNEVLLSALRGASRAYGRKYFISHLALQWYSTPHDTPANCRRYQLALFVCYLQGVSQINTEEGLWHMEENFAKFDRFSHCCRSHADVERQFVKFVECHTRRGEPVAPIAAVHGRYDGWRCFGRGSAWGKTGPEWKFSTPEESWDLLRVFYPDAVLDAIYRHPCPEAPQGFYTRTPYGMVDILPAEAPQEQMDRYGFMAFLGYHAAEDGDLERLIRFVRQGGTLLLAWPHLFTQTNREKILRGESELPEGQEKLTGVRLDGFVETGCGYAAGKICLGAAAEVLQEKNGFPLVIRHSLGKGSVILVNVREYPAAEAVRPVYEDLLKQLGDSASEAQREKGWMRTQDTVEFSAYDDSCGARRIYAINTNWWQETDETAAAELLLGSKNYPLQLERGVIHTFTVCENFAVWTSDFETEVISCEGDCLQAQGAGPAAIRIVGSFSSVAAEGWQTRQADSDVWVLTGELKGISRIRLFLR